MLRERATESGLPSSLVEWGQLGWSLSDLQAKPMQTKVLKLKRGRVLDSKFKDIYQIR